MSAISLLRVLRHGDTAHFAARWRGETCGFLRSDPTFRFRENEADGVDVRRERGCDRFIGGHAADLDEHDSATSLVAAS
jgi:hypothetical protein